MNAPALRVETWLPLGLTALLVAIPLITWILSVGDLTAYFTLEVPRGQILYLASKLCALAAVVLISIQLALGLSGLVRSPSSAAVASRRLHRALGVTTLLVILAHAFLFIAAASLRNKTLMLEYLWPDYSHGYYRSMISIGAIALIGVVLTVTAGFLRWQRRPMGRWLHWIALPSYALIWIHSLTIGSESRMGLMTLVYGLLALLIATALVYRLRRVLATD